MCAVADSEVVIARIEDVALCAVGVIGREEVAGHIDRDSLGCTCGHVDLVIAQQLDRGLFDVVLLVVVGSIMPVLPKPTRETADFSTPFSLS